MSLYFHGNRVLETFFFLGPAPFSFAPQSPLQGGDPPRTDHVGDLSRRRRVMTRLAATASTSALLHCGGIG